MARPEHCHAAAGDLTAAQEAVMWCAAAVALNEPEAGTARAAAFSPRNSPPKSRQVAPLWAPAGSALHNSAWLLWLSALARVTAQPLLQPGIVEA